MKRCLREAFWAEAERLPEGSDYVVVARPDARELAERDGMPGIRTALAELVDQVAAMKACVLAPLRFYRRFISPGCRRAASTTRRAPRTRCRRSSATAYCAGVVLAVWRVLRCNPWSHGGYDPPEAQTLFARRPTTT